MNHPGFVSLICAAGIAAGCGGHSAQQPSPADKKACALALYQLDVRVWVLHQPIAANIAPASKACWWVPQAKLEAATRSGLAGYQARLRKLFG